MFFRGNPEQEPDLDGLDALLNLTLVKVEPRPGYVKDLGRRLASYPNPLPIAKEDRSRQQVLLAVLGVLSGTFLVAIGIRLIVSLLGAMGVLPVQRKHASSMIQ